jgi:hypothetical protein
MTPEEIGRAATAAHDVALWQLMKILHRKGVIDSEDWALVVEVLTGMSAAYEMKPSHRASFERLSQFLHKHRPTTDPSTSTG